MANDGKERRHVKVEWEVFDAAVVSDGWVLPSRLDASTEMDDGSLVRIEVEVAAGKARARSVTVESVDAQGIGWTILASVPVRDIVATACLAALKRLEPGEESAPSTLGLRSPTLADSDEARRVIRALVGYRPDLDAFEGVLVR